MKCEIILKQRPHHHANFEVKYKVVVNPEALKQVYRKFQKQAKELELEERCECVVLVNELDDNGEFEQIIDDETLANLWIHLPNNMLYMYCY